MDTASVPLSGRRAQAARNDQRILEAARAIFIVDPDAPISAVAEQAGVGISALYRRYRSKEDLLQRLALDGLRAYLAELEAALADQGSPWSAFTRFMQRSLDAGTMSLSRRLSGRFPPTEELYREGRKAHETAQRLIDRTKAAGALRADIEVGDFSLLFEQLQAISVGNEERTSELRNRHLALMLDGLRAPGRTELPSSAPSWQEFSSRY